MVCQQAEKQRYVETISEWPEESRKGDHPVKSILKQPSSNDDSTSHMKSYISFSDDIDIVEIPALDDDMLDDMFYLEADIANFKYEAFMEEAGLNPSDFDGSFTATDLDGSLSSNNMDGSTNSFQNTTPSMMTYKPEAIKEKKLFEGSFTNSGTSATDLDGSLSSNNMDGSTNSFQNPSPSMLTYKPEAIKKKKLFEGSFTNSSTSATDLDGSLFSNKMDGFTNSFQNPSPSMMTFEPEAIKKKKLFEGSFTNSGTSATDLDGSRLSSNNTNMDGSTNSFQNPSPLMMTFEPEAIKRKTLSKKEREIATESFKSVEVKTTEEQTKAVEEDALECIVTSHQQKEQGIPGKSAQWAESRREIERQAGTTSSGEADTLGEVSGQEPAIADEEKKQLGQGSEQVSVSVEKSESFVKEHGMSKAEPEAYTTAAAEDEILIQSRSTLGGRNEKQKQPISFSDLVNIIEEPAVDDSILYDLSCPEEKHATFRCEALLDDIGLKSSDSILDDSPEQSRENSASSRSKSQPRGSERSSTKASALQSEKMNGLLRTLKSNRTMSASEGLDEMDISNRPGGQMSASGGLDASNISLHDIPGETKKSATTKKRHSKRVEDVIKLSPESSEVKEEVEMPLSSAVDPMTQASETRSSKGTTKSKRIKREIDVFPKPKEDEEKPGQAPTSPQTPPVRSTCAPHGPPKTVTRSPTLFVGGETKKSARTKKRTKKSHSKRAEDVLNLSPESSEVKEKVEMPLSSAVDPRTEASETRSSKGTTKSRRIKREIEKRHWKRVEDVIKLSPESSEVKEEVEMPLSSAVDPRTQASETRSSKGTTKSKRIKREIDVFPKPKEDGDESGQAPTSPQTPPVRSSCASHAPPETVTRSPTLFVGGETKKSARTKKITKKRHSKRAENVLKLSPESSEVKEKVEMPLSSAVNPRTEGSETRSSKGTTKSRRIKRKIDVFPKQTRDGDESGQAPTPPQTPPVRSTCASHGPPEAATRCPTLFVRGETKKSARTKKITKKRHSKRKRVEDVLKLSPESSGVKEEVEMPLSSAGAPRTQASKTRSSKGTTKSKRIKREIDVFLKPKEDGDESGQAPTSPQTPPVRSTCASHAPPETVTRSPTLFVGGETKKNARTKKRTKKRHSKRAEDVLKQSPESSEVKEKVEMPLSSAVDPRTEASETRSSKGTTKSRRIKREIEKRHSKRVEDVIKLSPESSEVKEEVEMPLSSAVDPRTQASETRSSKGTIKSKRIKREIDVFPKPKEDGDEPGQAPTSPQTPPVRSSCASHGPPETVTRSPTLFVGGETKKSARTKKRTKKSHSERAEDVIKLSPESSEVKEKVEMPLSSAVDPRTEGSETRSSKGTTKSKRIGSEIDVFPKQTRDGDESGQAPTPPQTPPVRSSCASHAPPEAATRSPTLFVGGETKKSARTKKITKIITKKRHSKRAEDVRKLSPESSEVKEKVKMPTFVGG